MEERSKIDKIPPSTKVGPHGNTLSWASLNMLKIVGRNFILSLTTPVA
jgi:hypothetical protein